MSVQALHATPSLKVFAASPIPTPRHRLKVPAKKDCSYIGGRFIFGRARLRIGSAEGLDRKTAAYFGRLDARLAANEAEVGISTHREQLAWVFCQFVRVADSMEVPMADKRVLLNIDKRLGRDPLGEAMMMLVWAFLMMERSPADDSFVEIDGIQRRDGLRASINRARKFIRARSRSPLLHGSVMKLARAVNRKSDMGRTVAA